MSARRSRFRLPRPWRDERGATAVEFALVSPVLILLLVGTFQVAYVMHCAATVRWSLESSARALLLDPTTTQDQIKSAMLSNLNGMVDTSRLSVALTTDSSSGTLMYLASSTYTAPLSIPFLQDQSLTFHATTVVPSPS